jgi:hypothetical protein
LPRNRADDPDGRTNEVFLHVERLRQIKEGGANAAEVRAKVAAILEYMATTEASLVSQRLSVARG